MPKKNYYDYDYDYLFLTADYYQILTKISFVMLDIVVKKQIECGLAWCVLISTTIRVITVVKICCGLN